MIQRVECPRLVVGREFYRFRALPQCVRFAHITMLLHMVQGLAYGMVTHG